MTPFAGLDVHGIYRLLTSPPGPDDLPRWPPEAAQRMYAGASGPFILRRAQHFLDMLDADGAFTPGWKGLDYGCGFGRHASLLLAKGSPEQLDLVDAWDKSLALLAKGNFRNRWWKVSEILQRGELPLAAYDFAYSFSIFTHLAPRPFWTNLHELARAVRPGGTLYFTVRHLDFVERVHPDLLAAAKEALAADGFWFTATLDDADREPLFGAAVIAEGSLRERCERELGAVRYLGQPPDQLQHVYALTIASAGSPHPAR